MADGRIIEKNLDQLGIWMRMRMRSVHCFGRCMHRLVVAISMWLSVRRNNQPEILERSSIDEAHALNTLTVKLVIDR